MKAFLYQRARDKDAYGWSDLISELYFPELNASVNIADGQFRCFEHDKAQELYASAKLLDTFEVEESSIEPFRIYLEWKQQLESVASICRLKFAAMLAIRNQMKVGVRL